MGTSATDRFVELNGLRFHYRDWGGPASGRPIVLLHGLASTAHIWDLAAPRLAERARLVALDQRGHGESAKPDTGYDFGQITADLEAFLAALGLERPVLVGHSWGGNVVLAYGATRPEGPRAPAGLVLVDGGTLELQGRPEMTWERAERELAPPDLSALTMGELRAMAPNWDLAEVWSPAVEAAALAVFDELPDGRVRARLSRANHIQILRALWEQRPSQLYGEIRCPVLIVPAARTGDNTQRAPGGAAFLEMKRQALAQATAVLPQAEVIWLDSVHDVPLMRPAELAMAIERFIAALA